MIFYQQKEMFLISIRWFLKQLVIGVMTYEYFINQPMSMCERKIFMNIARNPHLMNSSDRDKNHPLIRKYLRIPFKN